MKIVFFGTSDVGLPILEALAQKESGHELVQVITSPDAMVGRKQEMQASAIANLAASLNLPVQKPERVKNNSEFIDFLKTLNADIFIVVSYGKILPIELLDIPPLKTLNVHFSLLPKYRGAAPIQYALLNGETVTGTTIFILDELVDHGPILAQQEYPIDSKDTFETLAKKLADVSTDLLINLLPKYESGSITSQFQNHDEATFTKLIKKEHGRVDWLKPASEIYNMLRAYTPWPGIWCMWNEQIIKILEAEVVSEAELETNDAADIVKCGNNTYLRLVRLQPAGKKPMSIHDFLNGQKTFRAEDLI